MYMTCRRKHFKGAGGRKNTYVSKIRDVEIIFFSFVSTNCMNERKKEKRDGMDVDPHRFSQSPGSRKTSRRPSCL